MLKRFDQDQDGKLNDEERAAARKAFEARRGDGAGNRGPRGGGPGAGQGRPDREKMRAEMLKRFDKDSDGKLSDEERAEMRKQFEARRGGRGGNRRGGHQGRPSDGDGKNADQPDSSKPDENKSSESPASGTDLPDIEPSTGQIEVASAGPVDWSRSQIALAIAQGGR